MIPAKYHLADIALNVHSAHEVEYTLFSPFENGIERFSRDVVNVTVHILFVVIVKYMAMNHVYSGSLVLCSGVMVLTVNFE